MTRDGTIDLLAALPDGQGHFVYFSSKVRFRCKGGAMQRA